MLNHDLQRDEGILVLRPEGPLEATDFDTLAAHVDAYLEQNGTLHGVLIEAKAFPGWKNFAALLAHLKFVKRHHRKIEKVAVVADDGFATVMPQIASHFIHAELRHFDHGHESAAWEWLKESTRRKTRTAA
ncbi:MAG TPA: STAS/SEC14 domain-containing protein [Burkholderiales bacterium]|nr:STAS/SEC14 domain-containing protein [Burkholderiales bacterium]